jgi:hypothetical protein
MHAQRVEFTVIYEDAKEHRNGFGALIMFLKPIAQAR